MTQLENAERAAVLINEKLECLRRIEAIDAEIAGGAVATVAAPKKRGPKPGPKASAGTGTGKRGRPKGSKNKPPSEGGRETLPDILMSIAKEKGKPLPFPEFVELVMKSGRYKSKATDKSNMIYQALRKLVEQGVFSKPDKDYILAKEAA